MSSPKKVTELRKALAKELEVSKLYPRSHTSTGMMKRYQRKRAGDHPSDPQATPSGTPNASSSATASGTPKAKPNDSSGDP